MNNPNDKAVMTTKEGITQTAKISGFNEDQIKLVIQTVAKGATFPELQMFLYIAKKTGLDPLAKQIHFTKFKDKNGNANITIITGIDGYRSIASKTGKLAGIEDVVFNSEEDPKPKKASVTVYRMVDGQKVPFTATARWDEYFPSMPSKQFMWNKMPYTMLGKCAEALALRKGFPNDLSQVFVEEEMDQAHIAPKKVDEIKEEETYNCEECQVEVNKAVASYSQKMKGKVLCADCQKQPVKVEAVEEAVIEEEIVDDVDMANAEEVVEEEMPTPKVSTAPKGMEQLKAVRDKIANKNNQ
jgi:phage recombination protein Bet